MSISGCYLFHWYHPVRHKAACGKHVPGYALTSKGSEAGCSTCARLNSQWIHKQVAVLNAPLKDPAP
jgi:hypothetical protein